jgi:hypothetical protein
MNVRVDIEELGLEVTGEYEAMTFESLSGT